MNLPQLRADLRRQFVDSLFFESDPVFRSRMGRLVKRTILLVGTLGPIALSIYLFGEIVVVGKEPVLNYHADDPPMRMGLWDKFAMLGVFGCLLVIRRIVPDRRPSYGRLAMAIASIVVTSAITLDDVYTHNTSFTPAYVTLVVLLVAGLVPMRWITLLVTTAAIVGAWLLSITELPQMLGVEAVPVSEGQVVFLVVIAVFSAGASTLLYNVHHEQHLARKQAEELGQKLASANRKLEQAILDLRSTQNRLIYSEKMASLGRFAAGVAHEMRNPLNFVMNFAKLSGDILKDAREDGADLSATPDLLGNLERIQEHAERAERIVKSLISHSQRRASEPSSLDVNQLVEEQASVLAQRFERHSPGVTVALNVELDDEIEVVHALAAELTHALEAIVDNAYRAVLDRAGTGVGGYQPEITVSTTKLREGVRIEIRDNGVGMTESECGKVFEPFYTTRTGGQGTGLGLSSAYAAITEAHGGTITVKSEPGRGSVFTIEFGDVKTADETQSTTG